MRLLSTEHMAALTDALTWSDNPFVRRDARRDRKRRQPFISFAWMCGVLLGFGALGVWGIRSVTGRSFGNAWFIGGDLGTTLCILLSGVHIFFVIGASQKHTLRAFSDEVSHDTLSSLLLVPITPFQLVLQAMVYPWLVAMRAAVVLLPLYAVCVGLGGVGWLDVLMLYIVFGLAAVNVPRWGRPILSEDVGLPSTVPETNALSARGPAATPNMTGANSNSGAGFGQLVSLACFAFVFLLMSSRGNLAMVHGWVRHYVPESIFVLMPTSLLSWPLLLARGMVTRFDWFGYDVVPLPFVLVYFVGTRYTQAVRVSEWLQVGRYRDLPGLPTYRRRRRLEGVLQIGLAFVVAGYLWRWMIRDGHMASLVTVSGPANAIGLPGFAYAILFVTVYWRGLGRVASVAGWQRAANERQERPAVPQLTRGTVARYLAEPFLFAILYYLACCAVGRTFPFPPGLLPMAGRVLAVGLSGMLLRYGLARIGDATNVLTVVFLPLVVVLHAYHHAFHLDDRILHRLAYLSPCLGLLDVGNPNGIGIVRNLLFGLLTPPLPWLPWVVVGGSSGLALIALSCLTLRRRNEHLASGEVVCLDPTQVGKEAFSDAPSRAARDASRSESPVALALQTFVQRFSDNAVLTRELRVRLRGKLQPQTLVRVLIVFFTITAVIYYAVPGFTILGVLAGKPLLAPSPALDAQTASGLIGLWYLATLIVAPFLGMGILPFVFAVEQEKSTLGFTLTTPMGPLAIVLGKLTGLLLPNSINLALLSLWALAVSVVFSPILGLLVVLRGWCVITLTAVVVMVTFAMIALAVSSLFPRRLTVRIGGLAQGIMIYAVIFGAQLLGEVVRRLSAWTGLTGAALWLALIIFGIALSMLCLLISVISIARLRRGDVLASAGRRDN